MKFTTLGRAAAVGMSLALMWSAVAIAAVSTDQADYSPGSVVTISGDNSNGVGYLPGETVDVAVSGPNGWTAACSGIADEYGAWSCQITLDSDPAVAVGDYSYSATAETSGVVEAGTFTDATNIGTSTSLNAISTPLTAGQTSVAWSGTVTPDSGDMPGGGDVDLQWFLSHTDCSGSSSPTFTTSTSPTSGAGDTFSSTFTAPAAGTYGVRAAFKGESIGSGGTATNFQNSHSSCQTIVVNSVASDTTKPSISYSQSPDGSNDWFKTAPASVTVTATDVDDNVTSISCTLDAVSVSLTNQVGWGTSHATGVVSTSAEGNHVVSCTATDSHSNTTSPAATTNLKLDTVAPTITDNGVQSGTSGNNGWYISAVVNRFSASDGTSGLDPTCFGAFPKDVSTGTMEGSSVSVSSGSCTDLAGNTNSGISSASFKIDLSDPTIDIVTPPDGAQYVLNQVVDAAYSCDDTISGIDPYGYCTGDVADGAAIDTSSIGSKSFTVDAEDNAGRQNSATNDYSVIWHFTGFFQPVDNAPTCNTVKAGQAIPVKFSLDGYQGMNIFAAGFPKVSEGTCAGANLDQIESTVTAGNSSLNYDSTTDQYIYVWKTDKSWAGHAKLLTITLADGTTHIARFTFTK